MQTLQRSGAIVITALLAVLLAACNMPFNQTPTTTANQGAPMNKADPTATMAAQGMNNGTPAANGTPAQNGMMDGGNTMQGITITPDAGGNMAAFIHTGKVTMNGQQVNILLTNKNFAIYYYKPDTNLMATCTGDCAKDWPPVLADQGMMAISSSMTLPGKFTVQKTANGAQVFYDGHALYTYAEDKQAGNAMGHGQDMQWYLVDTMMTNMTTNNGNTNNGNTNNGNNGTMNMQGITITPAMTNNTMAFIHTGTAIINGNKVNVLITNKNFAIYYYKADTMFKSTCTGDCAKDWPPVLADQGMMTVSSSMMLPKKLSIHQTANGNQVFYDGHALYTYAEDKQAGNAMGRGQDMQWYLVGFLL